MKRTNNETTSNSGLKIKSSVKAGGIGLNHNPVMRSSGGLRIKSSLKAGSRNAQHNHTVARAASIVSPK